MYPEDRVLVGVMPDPRDFEIASEKRWYRVPVEQAPHGIHAEYLAFYFTRKYPEGLRWTISYFARRAGHELARRVDLFPDQPDHPRAQHQYYKIQLGELREKQPPIVSLRWRRIAFIQTTWDRFVKAREINDLFSSNDEFVDRIYRSLKARGVHPERNVELGSGAQKRVVDLVVPCSNGPAVMVRGESPVKGDLLLLGDEAADLERIDQAIALRGGPAALDAPF